jgi:hypothetical protein
MRKINFGIKINFLTTTKTDHLWIEKDERPN